MSWSASATIPKGSTEEQMGQILEAADIHGNDDRPVERGAAFGYAALAAIGLIQSGALGDPAAFGWNVSLSGHCNPNHATTGLSNDCLTVRVDQATEGSA